MNHTSPFTDWVYDAWDQLVLDKGSRLSIQERQTGWRELYERCYVDGAWTVSIHDAELVATLGWSLGGESGDYLGARARLRELMSHPDFGQIPAWLARDHMGREAVAAYLCGDTEHALLKLRQFLTTRGHGELVLVRSSLRLLLHALGTDHVPEEGLVALVADVIAAHRGRKRLAKSVRDAQTTTELQDALRRCFPR